MGEDLGMPCGAPAITLPRRGLITGIIALCAAPSIVRASSLMAIKPVEHDWSETLRRSLTLRREMEKVMYDRWAMQQTPHYIERGGWLVRCRVATYEEHLRGPLLIEEPIRTPTSVLPMVSAILSQ